MTLKFWRAWLIVVAVFISVFGLVMAFFNATSLFEPLDRVVDPVFWQEGSPPPPFLQFKEWVYGAWGATLQAD